MWRTLWLSLCLAWPLAGWAFGFDDVAALAQRQAAAPWQGAAAPMPDALARLTKVSALPMRYPKAMQHNMYERRAAALKMPALEE